jgi:hypothetical protein
MYSLVWTNWAYDELADIWVAVDTATRDRIEAAILSLNKELQEDPWWVGESRAPDSNRRIAFAGPIAIIFRINDATRTVRVNHVWRYGK